MDFSDLIELILETSFHYGQFVFKTTPYKVETYNEIDWLDQTKLFNRANELELIPLKKHNDWKIYLEGLKK